MLADLYSEMSRNDKQFSDPDWVLKHFEKLADGPGISDTQSLHKLIVLHQSRIESRNGEPVQLFPFTRDPIQDTPRMVVIDPELRFGRPTVRGVPTDAIVERWRAGDAPIEIAEDYGIAIEEIEEALRYESLLSMAAFFELCLCPPFGG